jgi:Protein of unknown function (DUF2934)
MPDPDRNTEQAVREAAYFIWEREGAPKGALRTTGSGRLSRRPMSNDPGGDDHMEDEEQVLAGRPDANMPALLTKDVPGG